MLSALLRLFSHLSKDVFCFIAGNCGHRRYVSLTGVGRALTALLVVLRRPFRRIKGSHSGVFRWPVTSYPGDFVSANRRGPPSYPALGEVGRYQLLAFLFRDLSGDRDRQVFQFRFDDVRGSLVLILPSNVVRPSNRRETPLDCDAHFVGCRYVRFPRLLRNCHVLCRGV